MARVKSFSSTYGMSLEIGNVWHKFAASIEIEIDEGDDVSEVKQKAHDTVQLEVEKQLQAAIDAYAHNK